MHVHVDAVFWSVCCRPSADMEPVSVSELLINERLAVASSESDLFSGQNCFTIYACDDLHKPIYFVSDTSSYKTVVIRFFTSIDQLISCCR